jgi:beta-N-acetylhexosaminidase
MQTHTSNWRVTSLYTVFAIVMCCILLALSGCGNPAKGSIVPSTQKTPRSSPTSLPLHSRIGGPEVTTESMLRAQLARVQQIMAGMSLDQKLGQLIMLEYLGNSYAGSGLQYMIARQFVGGFMYQESNHNFEVPYDKIDQVAGFSRRAMNDARIPLLIATDQEGGQVNRLYIFHGYLPSAEAMAATGNPHVALDQGTQAAKWMLQLGINADLAPVVDVHTVDPPVLQSRMFGSDPRSVALYAGAYLNGLQNNGVMGCLKHFPGLGAVTSDPHDGLPTITRSLTELEKIDLAPYKLMIQKYRPAMIMSTDVLMPAIDPSLPAELSYKAITGILRGELGYDGVVVTDGLYMAGISDKWTLSQAAVLSILAGDDIVEGPYTPSQVASVVTALKQAIQHGKLTIDRINQSVQRILLMKLQYGVIHMSGL